MTFEELPLGTKTQQTTTITAQLVEDFARVTGDTNPVHLDEAYAATTRFGKRIAHGMLSAGLISKLIGTELPGEGSIYMGQELAFLRPVFLGDEVTVEVSVIERDEEKKRVVLSTTVSNQSGKKVLDGKATVLVPA